MKKFKSCVPLIITFFVILVVRHFGYQWFDLVAVVVYGAVEFTAGVKAGELRANEAMDTLLFNAYVDGRKDEEKMKKSGGKNVVRNLNFAYIRRKCENKSNSAARSDFV